MANQWTDILTAAQIEANFALTDRLDPAFAKSERTFWQSRAIGELHSLKSGAWLANDADTYQMARSYIELAATHIARAA